MTCHHAYPQISQDRGQLNFTNQNSYLSKLGGYIKFRKRLLIDIYCLESLSNQTINKKFLLLFPFKKVSKFILSKLD